MSLPLFDPESNGLVLQKNYRLRPEENVVEDRSEIGSVKSVAISDAVLRKLTLPYRVFGFEAREYLQGFYDSVVGAAGRFEFDLPELVASPTFAPTIQTVVSGSQASRTISARFTWVTDAGETRSSPTASIAVPANELVQVALPVYPAGVAKAKLYAAEDSPGNEELQEELDNERVWTQPDGALLTGTGSPPSTNTAKERITAKFVLRSLEYTRLDGPNYDVTLQIEEVYV